MAQRVGFLARDTQDGHRDLDYLVTSGGGRRVALEKVTYTAPEGAEAEE